MLYNSTVQSPGAPKPLRRGPAPAAGHPGPVRHRPEEDPGLDRGARGDARQFGRCEHETFFFFFFTLWQHSDKP